VFRGCSLQYAGGSPDLWGVPPSAAPDPDVAPVSGAGASGSAARSRVSVSLVTPSASSSSSFSVAATTQHHASATEPSSNRPALARLCEFVDNVSISADGDISTGCESGIAPSLVTNVDVWALRVHQLYYNHAYQPAYDLAKRYMSK
jgi:hypothetical protein